MDFFPYEIRSIRPEQDAAAIADLIKTSFRPWLDEENLDYLGKLREAGEKAGAHPHWTGLTGFPYNISGFVCVDRDNTILGVINTNEFYSSGNKCCLISNVCTAGNHRGEGIAAHMLRHAESVLRTDGCYGLYLQTRLESHGAAGMYKKIGFAVTDYRESWILPVRKTLKPFTGSGLRTETVPDEDEKNFRKNFQSQYPASILWNLPFTPDLMQTGTFAEFNRLISFYPNRLRRVTGADGEALVWYNIQKVINKTDQLWLVQNGTLPAEKLSRCLELICGEASNNRILKLEIRAGIPPEVFKKAGFAHQHTLAWMWKKL